MTRSGNVVEFKINRADIGGPDRFGFAVFTANFDAADTFLGEDDAPDGGAYIYTMTFTQCANGKDDDGDGKVDGNDLGCSSPTDNLESDDPVTLKASKALTVPAKPKAGKVVVVGAAVRPGGDRRRHPVRNRQVRRARRHEGPAGKRQGRIGRRGLQVHAAEDLEGQDRARDDQRHLQGQVGQGAVRVQGELSRCGRGAVGGTAPRPGARARCS